MSIESAAALALSESSALMGKANQQVQKTADTVQVAVAQQQTGKNPIFKINPPSENNPAAYVEDDESIVRGAGKWAAKVLGMINASLADVREQAVQKIVDSQIDPTYLTPGTSAFGKRYAKLMADLNRTATAINLQKDEGHKLNKTAEMLVNIAKGFYTQAGSVIYDEAPLVISSGRLVARRGATVLDEADDILSRSQTETRRTNVYTLVAKRLVQTVGSDGFVFTSKGDAKIIAASGKSILLQAGKDVTLRADQVKLQSNQDTAIEAAGNMSLKASAGFTAETSGNVNIKGGMIFLGNGGTGPGTITNDTVTAPDVTDVAANQPDRKPGLLLETALGRNPAGANPPRTSPDEVTSR